MTLTRTPPGSGGLKANRFYLLLDRPPPRAALDAPVTRIAKASAL